MQKESVQFQVEVTPLPSHPFTVEEADVIDESGGMLPWASDISYILEAVAPKKVPLCTEWIDYLEWSEEAKFVKDLMVPFGRYIQVEITPLDKSGKEVEPLGVQPGLFSDAYIEVLYDLSTIAMYSVEGIEIPPPKYFTDVCVPNRNIRVVGFFKFLEGGVAIGYCEDEGISDLFIEDDLNFYPAGIKGALKRALLATKG